MLYFLSSPFSPVNYTRSLISLVIFFSRLVLRMHMRTLLVKQINQKEKKEEQVQEESRDD